MSGFDKVIPSQIAEYEIYSAESGDELAKVASVHLDLPDNFVFDPDYLYLWVRIVSAGEYYGPNKNGDYFPGDELIAYYSTFKTGHAFKNHENKKVENAIGEIITVRWNPVMKCVEIFKGIDKKRAPEVARGFIKGYLTDVSMGCKVPYTICSVCGNRARRRTEFCIHVNKYRMQFLGSGERVFEINYEPNFHDSSTVLTGAERVAKATLIIDTPPEGSPVAFQKAAGDRPGVTRFVKLTEQEMAKVASYQGQIHPMLIEAPIAKSASADLIDKLAELEKEVTGRLLNIVTDPQADKVQAASQMISLIKFLTDRRFDEDTLDSISQTINGLAAAEKISPQRVFSVFLGIAELLGIELYPSELHAILSAITDARLNPDLGVSAGSGDELYPSELAKGVKTTLEATEQLPRLDDGSGLFDMYNEGAHQTEELKIDPFGFVKAIRSGVDGDFEQDSPVRVVKVIRQTLTPFMDMRSNGPEYLLPRLATVLSGFRPPIGGADARRDFDILANPQTLGDMLATFAYRNYQDMRPAIVRTRMIRLAMHHDSELEKLAGVLEDGTVRQPHPDEIGPRGIKRRYLLALGVPAIYAASLFQKNRREHGRNLSDTENFVADHPGVISSGVVAGGKPLSRMIARGALAGKDAIVGATKKLTGGLDKSSSAEELEEITKIADVFPTGKYNVFTEDFLAKFAAESGFSAEEVVALKIATTLSVSGMEKEADEVLDFYQIPPHAKGMLLKSAARELREELEKVADDFSNNMILDGIISPHSLAATLPGRVVDSFVITKLMKKMNDPHTAVMADGMVDVSKLHKAAE